MVKEEKDDYTAQLDYISRLQEALTITHDALDGIYDEIYRLQEMIERNINPKE